MVKRARPGDGLPGIPEWRLRENDINQQERREAGVSLLKHLLGIYALKKMSAKEFCVACYYCSLAAMPGGNFEDYALAPDKQSGAYQRKLDAVLPEAGPLYPCSIPLKPKS